MNIHQHPSREAALRLLAQCNLPTSDRDPAKLDHFFGCGRDEEKGIVGVELHGQVALLRSLAVAEEARP